MKTKFIKTAFLGSVFSLLASSAMAVSLGSFSADATDDMESYAGGRATLTSLFGGTVGLGGSRSTRSVNAGNWTDFRGSSSVVPSSGSKFATIFGFGDISLDFTGIGGIEGISFWATAAGVGADVLTFFDMGGTQIGTQTDADGFGPGNGTMEFLSFVSSTKIGRITWSGPETAFDDISYASSIAPVPLPAAGGMLLLAFGALAMTKRKRNAHAV